MQIFRKVLTAVVAAPAVLLVLFVLLVAAFQSGPVQRAVQQRVSRTVAGSFTWRAVRISPLAGRVEVRDVRLSGRDGSQIAGFDRLEVDVAWLPLIRRRLEVQRGVLAGPWAQLVTDSTGTLNLLAALTPSASSSPRDSAKDGDGFNVVVRDFSLIDGTVSYHDSGARNLSSRASGIGLSASLNLKQREVSAVLKVDSSGVAWTNGAVSQARVELTAALRGDRLDTMDVRVATPRSSVELWGSIDSVFDSLGLDVAMQVDGDLEEVREMLALGAELDGKVRIEGAVRGAPGRPRGQLTVGYGGGTIWGTPVGHADARVRVDGMRVKLDTLRAAVGSGGVSARAVVDLSAAMPRGFTGAARDFDKLSYSAELDARDVGIAVLPGLGELSGVFSARGTLKGRGTVPARMSVSTTLDGAVRGFHAAGLSDSLDVSMRVAGGVSEGTARVRELEATTTEVTLTGQGEYGLTGRSISATLKLAAGDLHRALTPVGVADIEGEAVVEARGSGTVSSPRLSCTVQASNLSYQEVVIGALGLEAELDTGGVVRVPGLSITNQGSALHVRGEALVLDGGAVLPPEEMRIDAEVDVESARIEHFVERYSGEISMNTHVKGSPLRPEGTVDAQLSEVDMGVQKAWRVRLSARSDGETVTVEPLRIELAPGEYAELSGRVGFDRSMDLALLAEGIRLGSIDPLELGGGTEGRLSAELSAAGTMDNPQVSGEVVAWNLVVQGQRLEDWRLDVELQDSVVEATGMVGFDLSASYDLASREFSADLHFDSTRLAPYLAIAGQSEMSGTLSGAVEAQGVPSAWRYLSGHADIGQLSLFHQGRQLIAADTLAVRCDSGAIAVPSSRISVLEKGAVDVGGTATVSGDYDVSLDGDIPLRVLRPFVSALADIEGMAVVSATLRGRSASPDIDGDITLREVSFTLPAVDQRVTDLGGRIEVSEERIVVPQVTARLDGGSLNVSGEVGLAQFRPTTLSASLNATAVPVEIPRMMEATATSRLSLSGSMDSSLVKGEVVLLDGVYYKDLKLRLVETITQRHRPSLPSSPEADTGFAANMQLDVALKHRDPVRVENNIADLAVAPDLHIRGTARDVALSGRAKVVPGGTITYLRRTFEVRKGVIDFLNPYRIEPTLDIEAVTVVEQDSITLQLTGTTREPVVRLASTETDEDQEILRKLVVGRRASLAFGGSDTTGSDTKTQQMLANLLADRLEKGVKEATGLDIVDVNTSGEPGTQAAAGVSVTVGKHLTRRLTTTYSVESDEGEVVQRTAAEYRLREKVRLKTFQDSRGEFGAEVEVLLERR